ncbi:hypothetical protein L596_020149 [Steinernema carpocapsae]|uniref:Uncharacterized protein n=1 Tax=Steinernema carpocapsae TaxID=34508 RepID=A0A4U5MTH1_STECR|nr:hypothetical protein L596_020149 [Steinernema carpocapsae]
MQRREETDLHFQRTKVKKGLSDLRPSDLSDLKSESPESLTLKNSEALDQKIYLQNRIKRDKRLIVKHYSFKLP